ncbi:MAG: hypothetical protein E3J35_06965 [Methanomassiliicoccales archaeon]|nr:MAG: hypothetical protein E3J35_06965 [Methanomassiliicoccales archaeon]
MRAVLETEVAVEVELLPEVRTIFSSLKPIDNLIGPFQSSKIAFIDSASKFLFDFTSVLCVQAIKQFDREIVFLDAGNSVDPFVLSNLAKRFGMDKKYVLKSINVSRPFTAYQMATLIDERLEEEVKNKGACMLVVSSFPYLFLDEDVEWPEAYKLMERCVSTIQKITKEYQTISLITNYKLSNLYHRAKLRDLLYGCADKNVRFEIGRRVLRITLPEKDESIDYLPVPHNQTTLDDFTEVVFWEGRYPHID